MKSFITAIVILVSIYFCSAQDEDHEHEQEHEGHHHNEIGIANGIAYNLNEKISHYGLHLHVVKGLSHKLGIGLGYEAILGEHMHQTLITFLNINPFEHIAFNIGPGLTFPTEEHDQYELSLHTEVGAIFELGKFHLGPMLGMGFASEDKHITFGVHVAYGF